MADDHENQGRRRALGLVVVAGSALFGGAVALPAVTLATASPAAGGGERWLRVAKLADLKPGVPARVEVRGDERDAFTRVPEELLGAVWLMREGDGVRALSATCPHLGCAIDRVDEPGGGFACPCHTSRFGADGATRSGPSPRPMDALRTRVVGGAVEIDFRRYRQGISSKEEVTA